MMLRLTLSIVLLFYTLASRAQELKGRVIAAATGQPVAFATVGVKGKKLGSTADEAGRFAFAVPHALPAADSVIISCIGFRSLGLTVGELRQTDAVWRLQPQAQTLNEVKVRHSRLKPAVLGRDEVGGLAAWSTRDTSQTAVNDQRGREMATVLPIRRSCYVDSFRFFVSHNDFKPIRFRFRLYTVVNERPAQSLLTDDIQFILSSQQTGWISLDLRTYNIELHRGQTVAAGIQWLEGEKLDPEHGILSGTGAFPSVGHRVLMRSKSEAEWRSYPINVSMYLAVQQYE
jgi:hypothetical protein